MIKDFLGNTIEEGVTIVYVHRYGTQSALRTGVVMKFGEKNSSFSSTGKIDTMSVRWLNSSVGNHTLPQSEETEIEINTERFMLI